MVASLPRLLPAPFHTAIHPMPRFLSFFLEN